MYIHTWNYATTQGIDEYLLANPFYKATFLIKITGNFSDYEETTKETHTDFCFSFYFNNEFMRHDIFWKSKRGLSCG